MSLYGKVGSVARARGADVLDGNAGLKLMVSMKVERAVK